MVIPLSNGSVGPVGALGSAGPAGSASLGCRGIVESISSGNDSLGIFANIFLKSKGIIPIVSRSRACLPTP